MGMPCSSYMINRLTREAPGMTISDIMLSAEDEGEFAQPDNLCIIFYPFRPISNLHQNNQTSAWYLN